MTVLPFISSVLNLKSTPIVAKVLLENILSTKRNNIQLLPTPELPTIITLYPYWIYFNILLLSKNYYLCFNYFDIFVINYLILSIYFKNYVYKYQNYINLRDFI